MAGMAVSVGYMLAKESKGHKISMTYWQGHEEDSFLRSMGTEMADLEPKARWVNFEFGVNWPSGHVLQNGALLSQFEIPAKGYWKRLDNW